MKSWYLKKDVEVDVEKTLKKMLEKYALFKPELKRTISFGDNCEELQLKSDKTLENLIEISKAFGEIVDEINIAIAWDISTKGSRDAIVEYKPIENIISFYEERVDFAKDLDRAFAPYIDELRQREADELEQRAFNELKEGAVGV